MNAAPVKKTRRRSECRRSRKGISRPSELIGPRNYEIRTIARQLRLENPSLTIKESLAIGEADDPNQLTIA